MTQHEERAKAILRLRKLVNQTTDQGRTQHEMTLAMDKAHLLMTAFDIEMNEVILNEEPCDTIYIDTGLPKADRRDTIVVAMGAYLACRVWRVTKKNAARASMIKSTVHYAFFGMESDLLMAEHLFSLISTALANETKMFMSSTYYNSPGHRGCKRIRLVAFQKGFASELCDKFRAMAAKKKKDIDDQHSTGTSLVVVKNNKVEEEFAKIGMRLVRVAQYRGRSDYSANASGREAGANINLNRPITGSTGQKALTYG